MSDKPKILAFAGSLRRDSFNKKLIKIAAKAAEQAGAEVTLIDLLDFPLPIYNEDIEKSEGLPENALKLKDLLLSHDGFLISTPEYNSSVTGVLKNAIDWASRKAKPDEVYLCCFIDKVAALISASPSHLGGLRGLLATRSILENIYTYVIPNYKCISKAEEAFNPDGSLKDSKQLADIEKIAKKLTSVTSAFKKDVLSKNQK